MKKENISSVGTVITSLLATSCCIGPAIFVVFGTSIGVFGKLSFLSPVRPYLMVAACFMLSYSFWKLYLKKAQCACEEDMRGRKITRGVLWIGFFALVFSLSFEKVILRFYG
jgi:mercuric ion transport protein